MPALPWSSSPALVARRGPHAPREHLALRRRGRPPRPADVALAARLRVAALAPLVEAVEVDPGVAQAGAHERLGLVGVEADAALPRAVVLDGRLRLGRRLLLALRGLRRRRGRLGEDRRRAPARGAAREGREGLLVGVHASGRARFLARGDVEALSASAWPRRRASCSPHCTPARRTRAQRTLPTWRR